MHADEVSYLVSWLADRYFGDSFDLLSDKDALADDHQTYKTVYKDRILAFEVWARSLLLSPNVHGISLCDQEGAHRFVSQLVRLDRLPKTNPLEGLLLLQESWAEYDVAMHLADRFTR